MLAFVDASGDPGLKILNNSSLYFVVALVIFEEKDALECDKRIDQLRTDLRQPPNFEFHFSTNSAKIREAFLSAVAPCRFFYHIYALNKNPEVIRRLGLSRNDSLTNYVIRLVCENAASHLDAAKVVIDGQRGDRRFRDGLATYLRRESRNQQWKGSVSRVSVQRSSGNNLLQLADYIAGVSNRILCRRPDGIILRKYLERHEATVQVWPQI